MSRTQLRIAAFLMLLSVLPGTFSQTNDNTNVNEVSNPGGTTDTVATSETTVEQTEDSTTIDNENVNINTIGNTGSNTGDSTGASCDLACGLNAVCDNGVCKCPATKPVGDPLFYCRPKPNPGCFAFGDPKVFSYTGAATRIKLPCKTTLAQFDTPLGSASDLGPQADASSPFSTSDPPDGKCTFVVLTTTKLSDRGTFYTESVDVHVTIKRGGVAENVWVHLKDGSSYYSMNGGSTVSLTAGQCEDLSLRGKSVKICDNDNGMWNVFARACQRTEIMFRPWDTSVENQPETVGVGVTSEPLADFRHPDSNFPNSFCHTVGGDPDVYHDFKKDNKLDTKYASALYAALAFPPEQDQLDQICIDLIDNTFPACPTNIRVSAVNTCSPILLGFAKCAQANNAHPLKAFQACMKGVCSKTTSLCDTARNQINHPSCSTPPVFC